MILYVNGIDISQLSVLIVSASVGVVSAVLTAYLNKKGNI
jgi:hypothetical protein